MIWLWILIAIAWIVFSYFIVTTIVDIALMGKITFRKAKEPYKEEYFITQQNRIDIQTGFMCSGYSSAYILRHFGIEADGKQTYENMPNKMSNGYTYPKGIKNLFHNYGFRAVYCKGNLNTLKSELNKGNPIIVMIRVDPKKNWLHYVPVVGYDKDNIYLAESLPELVNCDNSLYNRKIDNANFLKLWNTAMLRQPLYKNTYYVIEKADNAKILRNEKT